MFRGHKVSCQCFVCKVRRGETKGKNNSFYGKKHSKKTKKEISKNRSGKCIGKNNSMYGKGGFIGKHHSEETKKKISESHLGKNLSKKHKENLSKSHKGKELKHQNDCQCSVCKVKRHETIGENHPNWKGGKSFEPYTSEFNGRLKRLIRKRDNYQCQLCGISENGRIHDIHHINYNKKDCKKRNLITLCQKHNTQANFKRDKWRFLFETLQELRGV